MMASDSSTPVPSFSKRTRLRMRSKVDASSALSALAGDGACASMAEIEKKNRKKEASNNRAARTDILQILYAVPGVKSNLRTGVHAMRIIRIMAMAMAMPLSFLGAFAPAQSSARRAIVDQAVPSLDPAVDVRIPLRAQGGVPPYRWSVTAGSLPEGISLTPDGVLTGRAVKPQKCTYTITVEDSASPSNRASKEFQTVVSA